MDINTLLQRPFITAVDYLDKCAENRLEQPGVVRVVPFTCMLTSLPVEVVAVAVNAIAGTLFQLITFIYTTFTNPHTLGDWGFTTFTLARSTGCWMVCVAYSIMGLVHPDRGIKGHEKWLPRDETQKSVEDETAPLAALSTESWDSHEQENAIEARVRTGTSRKDDDSAVLTTPSSESLLPRRDDNSGTYEEADVYAPQVATLNSHDASIPDADVLTNKTLRRTDPSATVHLYEGSIENDALPVETPSRRFGTPTPEQIKIIKHVAKTASYITSQALQAREGVLKKELAGVASLPKDKQEDTRAWIEAKQKTLDAEKHLEEVRHQLQQAHQTNNSRTIEVLSNKETDWMNECQNQKIEELHFEKIVAPERNVEIQYRLIKLYNEISQECCEFLAEANNIEYKDIAFQRQVVILDHLFNICDELNQERTAAPKRNAEIQRKLIDSYNQMFQTCVQFIKQMDHAQYKDLVSQKQAIILNRLLVIYEELLKEEKTPERQDELRTELDKLRLRDGQLRLAHPPVFAAFMFENGVTPNVIVQRKSADMPGLPRLIRSKSGEHVLNFNTVSIKNGEMRKGSSPLSHVAPQVKVIEVPVPFDIQEKGKIEEFAAGAAAEQERKQKAAMRQKVLNNQQRRAIVSQRSKAEAAVPALSTLTEE